MSDLIVAVKPPSALTEAEREHWMHLRAQNPALYSPYFHIGYTDLLSELRPDTAVIIAYDKVSNTPIAFLPFQGASKGKAGFAMPIGAPMTDYHGFIHDGKTPLDFDAILRQSNVGAFHFSALVSPQTTLHQHVKSTEDSAMIDISGGPEAWRNEQDSSYRRSLKSLRRRHRNSEKEIGPKRLVTLTKDEDIFDTLIAWKRQKFVDTGKYDVLSADWTLGLLQTLLQSPTDNGLRCDMHALYFGDRLAAVDLGLTDGYTYHSWIVAYDNELGNYSPGIQLLEELIDHSPELGYNRIDLGAGTDGYKRYYATTPLSIGSGFVPVKGSAATLSNIYGAAERFGEKSLADIPGKLRRRYSQIAACEATSKGRARAMMQAFKAAKYSNG